MKHILAIDLGTQSIRAGIVTPDGSIRALSQKTHPVESPHPGWAQQKASLWWQDCVDVIRDSLCGSTIKQKDIAGIITCGQMHGPTGIDESGRITTEWTQLWCDKRCEQQCIEARKAGSEESMQKMTGNVPVAGWTGLKVKWLKENQPQAYERTKCFLVPKDFINYKLTGSAATDFSEASGSFLLDANTRRYSEKMADMLGIDSSKFPTVCRSSDVIGGVSKEAASLTGLSEGIPVMAGGGDFIVSLVALGLAGGNTAVDITGTSTLFVVQKDSPVIHPAVSNLMHVLDGWVPFVMLDTGGLNMKWCRDFISSAHENEVTYERMITLAEDIAVGSEGLMFYPYLLGERRSDNVGSRGAFWGITPAHKAGHFARAVMEGTALALGMSASVFRGLGVKIDKVCCVGGATRNRLLNAIKANVYGVPVEVSDEPEATLIGAGLLGAFGLGLVNDLADAAAKLSDDKKTIYPDAKTARIYEGLQREFERFYGHMLGYFETNQKKETDQ